MQVKSLSIPASELSRPDANIWQQADRTRIPLVGVPLSLQPTDFIKNTFRDQQIGVTTELQFSALHNGEAIAPRL